MITRHILSLEAPESTNSHIFRLVDTSAYSSPLEVKCPRLEILIPGHVTPVVLDATPGFMLALNSVDLGLTDSELAPLPDGVYVVRYSVSPNEKVWIEYNILRTTTTINKYMDQLCRLRMGACEPEQEVLDKWKDLEMIHRFIRAAKIKVEWCGGSKEGMRMLTYAGKLLDRYLTNNCLTC